MPAKDQSDIPAWLGHFDLLSEEGLPLLRHTIPLRGARGASVEQLEDLLDAAASAACRPIDDKRGTKEYRIQVAGVLARRAALIAAERAGRNDTKGP